MRSATWIVMFGVAASIVACGSDSSTGGSGGAAGSGTGGTGGTAGSGTGGSAGAAGSASGGTAGTGTGGTGGTAGAAGSATGGAGGAAGAGAACLGCLQAQCGTEISGCVGDADCAAIFSCAQACSPSDATCLQACVSNNPNGKTKFDAITACVQAKCATDCS